MNKVLKSNQGVALLMAIFYLAILGFIATEVAYDSSVYYINASQKIEKLRSKHAAKAGVKISLIRIWVFNQIKSHTKGLKGIQRTLDKVWESPFAWPPSDFLTQLKKDDTITKDKTESVEDKSLMKDKYIVSVHPLSNKLNLNILAIPDKKLKKDIFNFFKKIILSQVELDERLEEKFNEETVEEHLYALQDWVDEDSLTYRSEQESSLYPNLPTQISLPLNLPFKTPGEVNMVHNISDDFLKLLEPYFSIYGGAKLSINYVKKDFFKLFLPDIQEEDLKYIFQPEEEAPSLFYTNEKDFFGNLEDLGLSEEAKNMLSPFISYDAPSNFMIKSVGDSGQNSHEITAITFDIEVFKKQIEEISAKKQVQEPVTEPPSKTLKKTPAKSKKQSLPSTPTVVYWEEN